MAAAPSGSRCIDPGTSPTAAIVGTSVTSSIVSTPAGSWTSFSNRLRDRRRSMQARGDVEFAFYERITGDDFSDESDDYSDDDEDEDGEEDEAVAGMELDEEESAPAVSRGQSDVVSGQSQRSSDPMNDEDGDDEAAEVERQRRRKLKGKGRDETTMIGSRADKGYSFSRRRPVIVLKRDSGWSFSQEAFFSSYQREQYSLCNPRSGEGRTVSVASLEGDEDAQPPIIDVFVSQEDSRRILPFA